MLGPLIARTEKRAELDHGGLSAGRFVGLVHHHRHMIRIAAQVPAVSVGGAVKLSSL